MSGIKQYSRERSSKKEQVQQMFDNIAPRYDFLNHFFSIGIDRLWRKKAIICLKTFAPKNILDLASGTADFAISALALNPEKITGIDISTQMLEIGKKKILKLKAEKIIALLNGDAENLIFPDHSFDAVITAFGVRNFENLERGLAEAYRVLSVKGNIIILEFSKPAAFPVKQLYRFYFRRIIPFAGKILSGNGRAYSYLPESVKSFPSGAAFTDIMKSAGFKNTKCIPLTFGIASIYYGQKL